MGNDTKLPPFVETWDTLLKHFCSKDDLRPAMCKPNIVGGRVYATDAHSWISVPYIPAFREYGTHEKTPNFAAVSANWEIIPEKTISIDAVKQALSKFSKKPDWIECEECGGSGSIECKCCGHESECENCDGTGGVDNYLLPEVYDNNDIDENQVSIQIGENVVAPFQLGRLLRAIEFIGANEVYLVTNKKHKALVFHAKDVEIIVMPLLQDNSEYKVRSKIEI